MRKAVLDPGILTSCWKGHDANIMELFLRSNIVLVIPTAIFEERGPGFDEILISRNALNRLWRMASLQESRRDGWVDLAVWEPNYDTSVFLSNSIHPPFAHITLLYNTFSHFTYLYLYLCLCLDLYLGAKLWHIGLFIQQHPSSPFLTINFFSLFLRLSISSICAFFRCTCIWACVLSHIICSMSTSILSLLELYFSTTFFYHLLFFMICVWTCLPFSLCYAGL